MAEVPVAPSFEPADICLNIDSLQVVKYKFIQVNYKVVLTILVHDLFQLVFVQTRQSLHQVVISLLVFVSVSNQRYLIRQMNFQNLL